jgi:dihydrofolate synthase/folylpolyglutamate synthase
MAYVHFADVGADPAVMEVGLGGRFDATNVADPLVSVITNISRDHTDLLGDTEEEIAREKVQIVPRGGTLVVGRVREAIKDLLADEAESRGAEMYFLGDDFGGTPAGENRFDYRGIEEDIPDISYPLPGAHQVENASVALAVVELLGRRGYRIGEEDIREGIENTRLIGRVQTISEAPRIIVDVCHNEAAAKILVDYLSSLPERKTALVVGMMADKDIGGFLRVLDGHGEKFFFANLAVPRAAKAEVLSEEAKGLKTPNSAHDTMADALSAAKEYVGKDGRIVVCGSFYTVEEAWRIVVG